MKRISILFLAIVTSICAVFCCGCTKQLDLYDYGLKMTVQMEELIKSDFYANTCLPSSLSREQFIANDYDTPTRVYSIEMPDKTTLLFKMSDIKEDEWNELSACIKEQILNSISMQNIVFNINVGSDWDTYVVATSYIITKQLDGYSLKKDISYLYVFETGKPIIVTFSSYHNGIEVKAQFLVTEKANSLSSLREVFEPFDCVVTALTLN